MLVGSFGKLKVPDISKRILRKEGHLPRTLFLPVTKTILDCKMASSMPEIFDMLLGRPYLDAYLISTASLLRC